MIPQLKEFELFTYRNSYEMINFDVSDEFVFICTCDEIHQYCKGSTIPVVGKLGFSPTFNAFFSDKFFIGSKENLYYFKYELYKLGSLNSLALCLFVNKYLIAVDGENNKIQVFNVECNNLCKPRIDHAKHTVECDSVCLLHEIAMKSFEGCNSFGLCSAYFIIDDLVFLGFESGTIVSFAAAQLSEPHSISFDVICTLKSPIITIVVKDSIVFALTLTGIFKIKIENPECQDFFTSVKGKMLLLFANLLILVQDQRLLIFDLDLNLVIRYLSLLEIKVCKIRSESFYVGFSNGLLVQYDLDCLIKCKKLIKTKKV